MQSAQNNAERLLEISIFEKELQNALVELIVKVEKSSGSIDIGSAALLFAKNYGSTLKVMAEKIKEPYKSEIKSIWVQAFIQGMY